MASKNLDQLWEAFDHWQRTQVCIRSHVRIVREDVEALHNGCEQALLLLERERFEDDPEATVVRAVLRSALGQ